MSKERARVSVTFSADYAENKKGETVDVSRSLAHYLISVEKVAKLTEEVKKKTTKEKVDK